MEGWYSMRCKLNWKLKATKSHRFYFQLVPSTLPTEGTEFGLLLTPTTREEVQDLEKFKKRMEKYPNGTTMPNLATQIMGMLPTPTAVQRNHPERVEALIATGATTMQSRNNGENRPNSILDAIMFQAMLPTPQASDFVSTVQEKNYSLRHLEHNSGWTNKMLPTPNAYDWNTPRKPETFQKAKEKHAQKGVNLQNPLKQMASMNMLPTPMASDFGEKLPDTIKKVTGQISQLSPQFVMEMMGFPIDWTLLPFLNGDKSQSKQEETQ
jgi:hypothetical protein